jgi:hypothetical protein
VRIEEVGDLLSAQNKTEEAMENYRKYLEKSPSDEGVAGIVGLYYFNKSNVKRRFPTWKKSSPPSC